MLHNQVKTSTIWNQAPYNKLQIQSVSVQNTPITALFTFIGAVAGALCTQFA